MESMAESVIKMVLAVVVVLAALAYWLLPKTGLARRFRMNEGVFVFTYVVGIMCGLAGLAVTFAWPGLIIDWHLWELIIIPFVLVYVYWGIIIRTGKTLAIVDEKQNFDMTSAAALTWALSIPAMVVMFILYYNDIVRGSLWFPYYFFVTLLLYSISTLYFFKKA